MTRSQTIVLQQDNITKLQSVLGSLVHTDNQLEKKDLLQQMPQPLSEILLSCGSLEWFCDALASYGPPKSRKPSNRGRATPRIPGAAKINHIISLYDTHEDDRPAPSSTSVGACDSDTHLRLCGLTPGSEEEEFSRRSLSQDLHLGFLARQENISLMKHDPGSFLEKLRPADMDRLRGSELEKLLKYQRDKKLSDESLFRYYDGAVSLENSNLAITLLGRGTSGESSIQIDTNKTDLLRVLDVLQQTSEQAAGADIRSRYYKVALYYQIEETKEQLEQDGKSSSGVGFLTVAIREWTKNTQNPKQAERRVRSWKRDGERWKLLCDKFSAGILEVSHKALSAW